MARTSSRTRIATLSKVFAGGGSQMLDSLARLSVLYEDLRIETFAITSNDREIVRLDQLGAKYRVNYFLRRSIATLLEFEGALQKLSRTSEYKAASASIDTGLISTVSDAIRFFQVHHALVKSLRNDIGGHFHHAAAEFATRHAEPDATAQIEITFDPSGNRRYGVLEESSGQEASHRGIRRRDLHDSRRLCPRHSGNARAGDRVSVEPVLRLGIPAVLDVCVHRIIGAAESDAAALMTVRLPS